MKQIQKYDVLNQLATETTVDTTTTTKDDGGGSGGSNKMVWYGNEAKCGNSASIREQLMYIFSYVDWMSKRDRVIRSVLNECDEDVGEAEAEGHCVCLCWSVMYCTWYIYIMYWLGMCVCLHVIAKKSAHFSAHTYTNAHARAPAHPHTFIYSLSRSHIHQIHVASIKFSERAL